MKNSPYIIGLTGGIGSGKTTITDLFIDLGVNTVDADIVSREVVLPNTPALNKITANFGKDILLSDGTLNRAKLRSKIFSSEKDKAWLNELLHPLIRERIFSLLKASTSRYCILIAPLLFEKKLHLSVNRTLTIDVDESIQISRTLKRDGSSKEIVESIMSSQIQRSERLKLSDDVILNQDKTVVQLREEVRLIDLKYRDLAVKNTNI